MKIVIDLTALSYHITGIERYALCISQKMIEIDKVNEYVLLFRTEIHKEFIPYIDNIRVSAVILKGNNKLLFYQIILPSTLYQIKANYYLFFAFSSPIFFWGKGIFNTIHDMGAWDCPFAMKKMQRLYFKITYRLSSMVSEGIITVSEFSKNRISKILKIPKEKIAVVYSAISDNLICNQPTTFSAVVEKYNLPKKYLMSLSTLEPRKNLILLLETFYEIKDLVDFDLVLVGRNGWKMDDTLKKYDIEKRVHLTGYVEDSDVVQIYKNTLCFVFPTLYEGFGLPPIEALALGAPVISSDAASMPEILMDQAIYFKSNDKEELKQLLLKLNSIIDVMPKGLNEIQKNKYDFRESAKKVLKLLGIDCNTNKNKRR